ncbi:ABC transporter permease [Rhizocola hellebori]|uniref:ABC transporter permease n=1 Tax=Rhizocola hellebori TaxID=1392758 RepID=A0A8J3Q6L4_9ACTN|nr:ABC transporter permease [Rhizocola hellebori]GIH04223.1 ABC transporter permease [Rhizocola hellebori]
MLSLASLKARWASLFGSFVALLLGVIMLTMTGLLLTSAKPQMPQRFSAAAIVVQSPDPLAPADSFLPRRPWSPSQVERLVAELSAISGVVAAIPDTPVYAQPLVDGKPTAATEGNSWPAAALAGHPLTAGVAPTRDDEVVMPGRVPGERVTILTAAGPHDYTVTGTAHGIYFFKPFAGVRAIGLLTHGKVDLARVERAVNGEGKVLTGADRAALESPADARTRWIGLQVLTAMAALTGFVAIFLVASTFSFSVLQRTRELGLLRVIGATPGRLRRMMFGEATLIGLLAGALGVALGALAAPLLGSLLVHAGFEPPSFTVRFTFWPMACAFLAGLMVALTGVVLASRRAASVAPLAALRAADAQRRPMTRSRWVFGLLAIAFSALLGLATATADALSIPTLAGGTVMALIAGIALLSPALVPPLARILLSPFASGPLGLLVRQSAFTAARRTSATAAPVMLAVAFTVLVTGMVQTGAEAYATRREAQIPGTAALIPDGTPGLTNAAVSAGATSVLPTTVWHGDIPLTALGLSAQRAPDRMVVRGSLAQQRGWTVGSVVPLTVASGHMVRLTVGEIADAAPADILVSRDSARSFDPDALTSVVYLHAEEVISPTPGAKMVSAAEYAALADAQEDRLVWMFTLVLVGMAGGFTIIAVANTLLMAAVARRRELTALSRLGATARQLIQLVCLETTFVVALGALLGIATALPGLLAIRAGLSQQIGHPVTLIVSWPALAAVVSACLVSALPASLLPSASASRARHRGGRQSR